MSDVASRHADTMPLPYGERPRPVRADAWSSPGARRRARRAFRPRRTIPGVLVAAVIAAAGILGCIWAVSAALGRPLWHVPYGDLAGPVQTTVHWADTGTLIVAAAVAFVGLVLLLIGVIPGRPRAVVLGSGDESVIIGVPWRHLRHSLAWLAAEVPGIDGAKVRTGRRGVRVRVTTRLRDPAGLHESVHAVIQERLDALDPLFPPRHKVRLRRKEG